MRLFGKSVWHTLFNFSMHLKTEGTLRSKVISTFKGYSFKGKSHVEADWKIFLLQFSISIRKGIAKLFPPTKSDPSVISDLFLSRLHCFNLRFFFSFVCYIHFCLCLLMFLLQPTVTVVAQLLPTLLLSLSHLFSFFTLSCVQVYLHTELCIPGRDKTFSWQHTGSDLPNLNVLRTEEYSCEKRTPLWPYLDLSSVVACHTICGVIYQMLTKGWYVQWCLSRCSMFRRNPSKHCW